MRHMRHRITITTALLLAGAPAPGDELANNLEQPSAGIETASGDRSLAARFHTDSASRQLTSVTIEIGADSADTQATVGIHEDRGYEPGDLVAMLSAPALLPTSLSEATFTASGVELEPDQSYWVVLTTSGNNDVGWAWSDSNDGAGAGFSTEWGLSDAQAPAFWWTHDGFPLKMRVVVDGANACPADLNTDGELNFFDVSAFITLFNQTDPQADFTGDGAFNFFDVSAFLSAFNAGCP